VLAGVVEFVLAVRRTNWRRSELFPFERKNFVEKEYIPRVGASP
jgi:hypothetical protein